MGESTSEDMTKKLKELKELISNYPDFPKPGILFRDMFSLLRNPSAFQDLKEILVEVTKRNIADAQVVVGLESRGFLFGTILALELQLPFVPIRKPGKLPGELNSVTYQLEYGSDTFEIQKDGIQPNQKVLLVDDLLATGGSLKAACQLVEKSGGVVAGCLVVMELTDLRGRDNIQPPVFSLMEF